MDAMTLYIVVRLASGEAHVALREPLNGRTCERAKLGSNATKAFNEQVRARPKLMALFCTDANGNPPEAFVSPRATADQPSPQK